MSISCVIRGQSKHSHAVGTGKENTIEGQKKEYRRATVLHKKLQVSSCFSFYFSRLQLCLEDATAATGSAVALTGGASGVGLVAVFTTTRATVIVIGFGLRFRCWTAPIAHDHLHQSTSRWLL